MAFAKLEPGWFTVPSSDDVAYLKLPNMAPDARNVYAASADCFVNFAPTASVTPAKADSIVVVVY